MPAAERQELVLESRGPEETEEVGVALGAAGFAGAVLLLEGPLGAGKTALARGLARGLEVCGPVTSPTFTILAVHQGRLPLFHVDLYRVETSSELRSVDLDEVFAAGGVAAVEWPRWLLDRPPPGALEVRIAVVAEGERVLTLVPRDARWAALLRKWPRGLPTRQPAARAVP